LSCYLVNWFQRVVLMILLSLGCLVPLVRQNRTIDMKVMNAAISCNMKQQTRRYDRSKRDFRLWKRLLPHLQRARLLGIRRLRDLHQFLAADLPTYPRGRPITPATLYRAILRLKELGFDPGLDDRSMARKLGRPTRKKS